MIEALGQGAATLFQPTILGFLILAVIIAQIIGFIPLLGGLMGMALLLPLIFRMSPEVGLTFLVAFHATTYTAGSITAILLNIPGTTTNAATLIDGFPMNQKGEGGRAIGAAVTASMCSGVLTVLWALLMIPMVLPILMVFKSPEMTLVILLGLASLASLTGGSVVKGIIAGLMGVLISLVGRHGATGVFRFTFGSSFLWDGFRIVPIALGLFGVAELIEMLLKGQTTFAQNIVKQKTSDILRGARDVWDHRWLAFRCSVIGYIIGIIPGVGAATAIFMAYAHAKQTSKHPELFGTGIVEGVIGPEASNNSGDAGGLLTTMALGLPGSASMGLLLGAFVMVGVTPGPRMLVDNLPLGFTLLLAIALANIIAGAICFICAPYLARVAFVHIDYMFPIILVVVTVGAFVMEGEILDVVVAFAFGLVGLIMRRSDYSRPSLLVGFVLGDLFEYYMTNSLKLVGPRFPISSVVCLILIILNIGVFMYPYLMKISSARRLKQS